jgi:hypothetical protein
MERVRGLAAYPEMAGKQSPQREQLRQHKARVASILSGGGGDGNVVAGGTPGFYTEAPQLIEEEPVEMQGGGLAQAMGQQRGSMGRRGSPQMMQAMQRRTGRGGRGRGRQRQMMQQMAQRRGRGRSPMGRGRGAQQQQVMQQMAQQRGGQGRVGPMRGPQRMQMPGRGMARPGPLGGMPGGGRGIQAQEAERMGPGSTPDDARMPGGRAMPLRGFQQKMAMQRRGNLGGNRVGSADQQGGLARAMQKQTGRPPISRRSAFPGRAR